MQVEKEFNISGSTSSNQQNIGELKDTIIKDFWIENKGLCSLNSIDFLKFIEKVINGEIEENDDIESDNENKKKYKDSLYKDSLYLFGDISDNQKNKNYGTKRFCFDASWLIKNNNKHLVTKIMHYYKEHDMNENQLFKFFSYLRKEECQFSFIENIIQNQNNDNINKISDHVSISGKKYYKYYYDGIQNDKILFKCYNPDCKGKGDLEIKTRVWKITENHDVKNCFKKHFNLRDQGLYNYMIYNDLEEIQLYDDDKLNFDDPFLDISGHI